jgi:prepilin-type N-terminal cleavage/methylation domain-containing protein
MSTSVSSDALRNQVAGIFQEKESKSMKMRICPTGPNRSGKSDRTSARGFTLVETLVAVSVSGFMLTALYACFASGFSIMKVTREDLRATQILLQRMETIRVADYTKLTNSVNFPTNTTVYFDEENAASGNGGTPYTVTFSAKKLPSPKPQSQFYTNMLEVTVGASWKSGKVQRSRSMQTYVSRQGLQQYVSGGY